MHGINLDNTWERLVHGMVLVLWNVNKRSERKSKEMETHCGWKVQLLSPLVKPIDAAQIPVKTSASVFTGVSHLILKFT